MGDARQLWVLAGADGAGKSTFYDLFLRDAGITFVNADLIAHSIAPESPVAASYAAAEIGAQIRDALLEQGASFCFETVFSHPSKVDFLARAKMLGYAIVVVFIHLDDPQLNVARVAQRVAQGGHKVPEDKIRSRIPRTLDLVREAVGMADEIFLLDNSSADDPFVRVATIQRDRVVRHVDPLPAWAARLLGSRTELG